MKKLIAISFLVLSSSLLTLCKAQDPAFSQPYANPLYLNPAFAGTGTSQRIGLNFRDQWPNIPGNFYDYGFSYDRNIIDSSFGIGVLGLQDRAGNNALITTSAGLIVAYQFHIKSFTLSVGAQGTFQQKKVDLSQLNFGDMLDPRRGFVYSVPELVTRTTSNVADFSAGLLGYGKHYFAGFAIDHFTQPNESFAGGDSPLPVKFTFHGGGVITAGAFTITPTFLYMKQQDASLSAVECYLSWKYFTIGAGTNLDNMGTFLVGFQNKFLRIGYSYDVYNSELGGVGGAHEISLAVLLHYKCPKLKKVNGINCPAF